MITSIELQEQINALNQQLSEVSEELLKLVKSDIEDLLTKQYSFANSVGVISATVASFSLLLFQPFGSGFSFVTRPDFILWGFSLLLINVVLVFLFLKSNFSLQVSRVNQSIDLIGIQKEVDRDLGRTVGGAEAEGLQWSVDKLVSVIGKYETQLVLAEQWKKDEAEKLAREFKKSQHSMTASIILLISGVLLLIASFALDPILEFHRAIFN